MVHQTHPTKFIKLSGHYLRSEKLKNFCSGVIFIDAIESLPTETIEKFDLFRCLEI
jgi:hypothetical protein